jgi:ABC-type multidrug transport system ATPase subunit
MLYAAIVGVGHEEAKKVGEERLRRVRLWHRKDGRVGTFSGGMRRRLSMVLSTIGDPKIVILDEVTTGLDPVSTHSFSRLLIPGTRDCWNFIEFFKQGRLIMLVTHSMEEAECPPFPYPN